MLSTADSSHCYECYLLPTRLTDDCKDCSTNWRITPGVRVCGRGLRRLTGSGVDRWGVQRGTCAAPLFAPEAAVGEGSALEALDARVSADPAPGRGASISRAEPSPTVRMTLIRRPVTIHAGVLGFCAACQDRSVLAAPPAQAARNMIACLTPRLTDR